MTTTRSLDDTRNCAGPAFGLLEALVRELKIPIVLEGRIHTVDQMRQAFDLGAHAVVVGTAITNIEWQVKRFAGATQWASRQSCDSRIE
jgi:N-acylglucosamine-6-phosphate 2-epimerase